MTTDIPAWFDRTFRSPFPVDLFPNLRARLAGTAARLDEAVRGHLAETLALGPPGKWSAAEHVWHLVEIEALWLARVEDFVATRDELTPANLTHRRPAESEPGAGSLADALREFRAARTRLIQRVDGLDASRFTLALPHPRLRTPMRLADHLYFVAEHDDHHLAHMLALLSVPRPGPSAPPVVPGYAPVFAPFVRTGNLIYLSGRLAKRDGQVWVGKLGSGVTVAEGKEAARGVAVELIATLHAAIGSLDRLRRIVRLGVFVNSTDQFTEPHAVADGASDHLMEVFGDRGAHARTAVGVAQTPFGACVEIDLIAEVADSVEARDRAVRLATEFLTRVWGPTHDLDAIDELMTEDYQIWSGGALISGRPAFKEWVRQFQTKFGNAHTEIVETFANAGDRVVSRWFNTGLNHGVFGLPADGRPVSFTGMSIWRVEDGRLAECWVERAAFESYQRLTR